MSTLNPYTPPAKQPKPPTTLQLAIAEQKKAAKAAAKKSAKKESK